MAKLKQLVSNKFVKNVAVVASGTAAAQIINFLLTPIITRLYGPDAFGALGTFMAVVNILAPIVALTYPIAIVLPRSNSEAKQIVKLSLIVTLCIGIIMNIVFIFAFDWIVKIFNLEIIAPFLLLIPIIVILFGLLQILEQWLIRTQQFRVTARTAVLQAVFINSSKIGVGFVHPFASALIVIQTVGVGFKALLMFLLSDRSLISKEDSPEREDIRTIAIKYKDFPLYRSPQVLFSAISQGVPVVMLSSLFGPAAAGFYALGRQALGTPVQLLGKAVQDVFYPKVSAAANDRKEVSVIIFKSVIALASIGLVPFGIIILFAPELFSFVFGSEWNKAGIYAQWIAFMSLFILISRPVIVSIPVLNKQKELLIFEIFGTLTKIGALFFGFYGFNSDVYAVAFYSLASMSWHVFLIVYTLWAANRFDREKRT